MSEAEKIEALLAPCGGEVIKLEDVGDEVFASGMLGVGFGVIPEGKEFYSPAKGKVTNAHEAGHAYMIETADGLELLVHIGINTVELEGEYFSPAVRARMSVSRETKLTYADVDRIRDRGYDPVTVVIVTNPDALERYEINYGKFAKGQEVMKYTLK